MLVGNKWATWIGYGLSGLVIAFMLFDGGIKLVPLDVVITATAELGYPPSVGLARGLGILGLVCTALYAYPRTSVLGAILLTGYLGGATATHVLAGGPVFPVVFAVGFGVLVWLGLFLRDERLRTLVPLRSD
jgi:DoxX-like family